MTTQRDVPEEDHMHTSRIGVAVAIIAAVTVTSAQVVANGATISATKTASLVTGDGDALAEAGEQIEYTVDLATAGFAADVVLIDTLPDETSYVAGSLRTTPVARNDGYHVNANIGIAIPVAELLTNDDDPDDSGAVTFVGVDPASPLHGDVSYDSTAGTVTYLPDADYVGADSFTYTVEDGDGGQDTATVALEVTGPSVWFVDDTATGSEDLGTYRDPFTSLAALGAAAGPSANEIVFLHAGSYSGSIVLDPGQRLIGQGVDLRDELTLAGLLHAPKSLLATSPTPLTRPTVTTSGGPGVALSSDNWVRGLEIVTTAGLTGVNGGAVGNLRIENAGIRGGGSAIDIAGSGNVQIALDRLSASASAITGPGVRLTGVTGAFIANDANGTITATGQRAVEIDGNPSLGLGMTLRSVSASGGANGISLVDTIGSFTVTGDGGSVTNGSGGTITNTTGPGVYLDSAAGVTLTNMNVQNGTDDGVYAEEVNGLRLLRMNVTGNGDAAGEHGMQIGDTASSKNGATGTLLVQSSTVSGNFGSGLVVENQSGTLGAFLVESSTFGNHVSGTAIRYAGTGTATTTAGVSNTTFTNVGDGVAFTGAGNTTTSVVITGSTVSQTARFATVVADASATMRFDVSGNSSVATTASGIRVEALSSATAGSLLEGRIANNTLAPDASSSAPTIWVENEGAGAVRATVSSNTVTTANAATSGIFVSTRGTGTTDTSVTTNNVSGPTGFPFDLELRENSTLCADILNNNTILTSSGPDVYTLNNAVLRLPGLAGSTEAEVENYLNARNSFTPGATADLSSFVAPSSGICLLPSVPSAPTAGGLPGSIGLSGAVPVSPPPAPTFTLRHPGTVGVTAAGSTVSVDLGDLDDGQGVTVTYRVQVATSLPPATTELCNSGAVTSSGAQVAVTDDPDTVTVDDDATCVAALGVNTGPTLTATGLDPTFTEGGSPVALFSGSVISTVETGQSITRITFTVTDVTDGADEFLDVDAELIALTDGNSGLSPSNMSYSVTVTSGVATVTVTFLSGITPASAQTLVDGLRYRHAGEAPTDGARVVTITSLTDDGGTANGGGDTTTLSVASTVTVQGVNDAPTITAPGSIGVDEDTPTALTGISFSDPDAGNATITVTMSVGSGTLAATSGSGVTVGGIPSSRSFTGTLADINAFIAGGNITYLTALDTSADATLTVAVDDGGASGTGGALTDSTTVTLDVAAVNDAPVNKVPGAQTTPIDVPLVFSVGAGNPISISDADAGSATVQTSLTATNGVLTMSGTTGVTFSTGDGTADATIEASGTVADLNQALDGLMFTPAGGFAGAASIQIVTDDQGNTGSGGAKSDTDTVTITVVPPAPTVASVAGGNGLFGIGDSVTITVSFDAPVVVTGAPTLLLETGAVDRDATYVSGSGTALLTFAYVIQRGDDTSDLDYTGTDALSANGGTIRDSLDLVDADLTLPAPGTSGSLSASQAIVVDGDPPTGTVVVQDTALTPGETTFVTITFSEPVTGFGLDDLDAPNGTLSDLGPSALLTQSIAVTSWTAVYTPNAGVSSASNTIVLDLSGVTDTAGNAGVGTTSSNTFAVETIATTTTTATTTPATPTTVPTTVPATGTPTGELPATGGGSPTPLPWALAALLLGAIGVATSRRRTS